MEMNKIEEILDEAKALGVTQVLISGGEPLYHPQWYEVMLAVRRRDLEVLLITNGLLLDETALAKLRSVECKKIGVSCDSLYDARYRRIRGTDRAPLGRALELLSDAVASGWNELNVSLCMTLHRENADEIIPILEFAIERGFAAQYQPYQRMGSRYRAMDRRFWPTEQQLPRIAEDIAYVREVKRSGRGNVANRDEYLAAIPIYFRDGAFRPSACYAPFAQITVDEHGGLRPCWALDPVGNLHDGEGALQRLWRSDLMQRRRREAAAAECPGCLYSCHLSKAYIPYPATVASS